MPRLGVLWVVAMVCAPVALAFANISPTALQAEFALKRGDKRQAVDLWFSAIERKGDGQFDVQAYPYVLTLALEAQDYGKAASVAEAWHAAAPESADALYYIAHVALKTAQAGNAAKALRSLLARKPASNLQRLMVGVDLTDPTYVQQLISQLEPLLAIAPGNRSVQMLLVQLYLANQQYTQAGTMLDKLLVLPNPSSDILFAKYMQLKQSMGYHASLKWLVKQAPDPRVQELLVRNLVSEGGYSQLLLLVQQWPFAIKPTGNVWREYMHSALLLGLANLATEAMLNMTEDFETADEGYYYLGKMAQLQNDVTGVQYFYSKVRFEQWEEKRIIAQSEFLLGKGQLADAETLITPYLKHPEPAKRYMAVGLYIKLLSLQNKDAELKKWLLTQLEQERLEYLGVVYRYIPASMTSVRDKYSDVLSEQHPEVLFANIQRTLKPSNASKYLNLMEPLQGSGLDPLNYWLTKAQLHALLNDRANTCNALNNAAEQVHEWLLIPANVQRWQQWCLPGGKPQTP